MTNEALASDALIAEPCRDSWRTPGWLRELIREQYRPRWDLAACEESSLGSEGFFSAENSFLSSHGLWTDVAWMNPPFSRAEEFYGKIVTTLDRLRTAQLVSIYRGNLELVVWQKHILPTCSWVFAPSRRIAYEEPVGGGVKVSSPRFGSLLVGWNVPIVHSIPGHALVVKG